MRVNYHRLFQKKFNKLTPKIKQALFLRLKSFFANKFDPILNNHGLHGRYPKFRSINITGDYRAIFTEQEGGKMVTFLDIDTHHKLYGK
ncbi:MAG: hypothetical protein AAB468_01680 [Patescibacteria group bacterium]